MRKTTKDNESAKRVFDDQSLEINLEKPELKNKGENEFIEINEQIYSQMLNSYSKSIAWSIWIKIILKITFFAIIVYILFEVLRFFSDSLNYIFNIITVENISRLSMESVLSAMTIIVPPICSLIVAFIKLPEIIAKYLFNKNEDKSMKSIVKSIQDHDRKVYKINFQEAAKKLLSMQNGESMNKEKELKENNKKSRKNK